MHTTRVLAIPGLVALCAGFACSSQSEGDQFFPPSGTGGSVSATGGTTGMGTGSGPSGTTGGTGAYSSYSSNYTGGKKKIAIRYETPEEAGQ